MTAVRFFGGIGNYTGYGNATKNFAKAFSDSGIKTKFIFSSKMVSRHSDFVESLNNYGGRCNIDFYLHCPPWNKHKSNNYKIAYFYWEADKLPRYWVKGLNRVDEIWVPCELVKNACVKAKFKGPIKIIPTPAVENKTKKDLLIPYDKRGTKVVSPDIYKFYSIFQWHTRKGYRELLTSYYQAFDQGDKVLLILKVNSLNVGSHTEKAIREDILTIKRKMNLKSYPQIYLSSELVSEEMIGALHNTADCYVSSHRGEGWGLPIHQAAFKKKQIIVTQYGGITEHLDSGSAHIINHTLGPVTGMEWSPLYGRYQCWAYPSINHLSKIMRNVYENHDSYVDKGIKASEIANNMTVNGVANMIKKELVKGR